MELTTLGLLFLALYDCEIICNLVYVERPAGGGDGRHPGMRGHQIAGGDILWGGALVFTARRALKSSFDISHL